MENKLYAAREEDLKNQPEGVTTWSVSTSGVSTFDGEGFSITPCKLCGEVSNPDTDGGCDRSEENGCNWYNPTIQEALQLVLSNPDIRANAVTNATYIQSKLKNWFTIDQVLNKTLLKDWKATTDLLDLLCLFELAYREEKLKGVIKYKITLSKEDRLKLLAEEISETQMKLDYLIKQHYDLSKTIAVNETKS